MHPIPNSAIPVSGSGPLRAGQRGRITGVLIRGGTAASADIRIRNGQLVGNAIIIPQIVAATNTTEGFVGFPVPFVNGFYIEVTLPAGAEANVYID